MPLTNASCQLSDLFKSKGDDEESDFEQEALLGHGMDASEHFSLDLTECCFDLFAHILLDKLMCGSSFRLLLLSRCTLAYTALT
jgi:hypothetical protein